MFRPSPSTMDLRPAVRVESPAAEATEIVATRAIPARPEHVFSAWSDPRLMALWLEIVLPGEVLSLEVEPRLGGGLRVRERREGRELEHRASYFEFDPPRRAALGLLEGGRMTTAIQASVSPTEGGCVMTVFTHLDETRADHAERLAEGWEQALEAIEAHLKQAVSKT
jgi:uncharacterized protein YndB with AHSA1/START domain